MVAAAGFGEQAPASQGLRARWGAIGLAERRWPWVWPERWRLTGAWRCRDGRSRDHRPRRCRARRLRQTAQPPSGAGPTRPRRSWPPRACVAEPTRLGQAAG